MPLHVYKDYLPVQGGIECYIRALAERQAASGAETAVLCCAPRGQPGGIEQRNGVRIERLHRWGTFRSLPLCPALIGALRRQTTSDVVHLHSPFPLGEYAALQLPPRMPIVVTHHADVVRQRLLLKLYAPAYRRFLRRADRIIVTSDAYRAGSPWLQPHLEKCRTVPLGIDIDRFSPGPARDRWSTDLLFVGRLRYYKGLDTLIDTLARLEQVSLTIAGDGPLRPALIRQAHDRGLFGRVRFLGDVSDADLPALYRSAKLFVLPANCRAEAFGTVLLEAMACGLPCVTTEIGTATSWVVRQGETGEIVPPNNPESLARVIRELLNDDARRHRYGAAARQRTKTHFSLDHLYQAVQTVYAELAPAAGFDPQRPNAER